VCQGVCLFRARLHAGQTEDPVFNIQGNFRFAPQGGFRNSESFLSQLIMAQRQGFEYDKESVHHIQMYGIYRVRFRRNEHGYLSRVRTRQLEALQLYVRPVKLPKS